MLYMLDNPSTPIRVMHRDHGADPGRSVLISVYGSSGKFRGHIACRPGVDLPIQVSTKPAELLTRSFVPPGLHTDAMRVAEAGSNSRLGSPPTINLFFKILFAHSTASAIAVIAAGTRPWQSFRAASMAAARARATH